MIKQNICLHLLSTEVKTKFIFQYLGRELAGWSQCHKARFFVTIINQVAETVPFSKKIFVGVDFQIVRIGYENFDLNFLFSDCKKIKSKQVRMGSVVLSKLSYSSYKNERLNKAFMSNYLNNFSFPLQIIQIKPKMISFFLLKSMAWNSFNSPWK